MSRPELFTNRLLNSNAMKSYLKSWICVLLAAFLAPVLLSANHPDEGYGLPGDDFSLEGALDLFKRSNSLEEFERALNSSDNNVNNLDLNFNGRIDYLRVVDHAEGDLHAIVIQALVGSSTSQDVAVIEVKRNRHGEAVVQIVGDEDLYGTAKIVEPYPYDDVVGTDYYDNYYDHYSPQVFVNVWAWPSVRFIYAPRYVVWASPYYYDYYPVWYSTWRPHPWNVWHNRVIVYRHHYCTAPQYRIPEAHHYYGSRRVSAPEVRRHTERYVAEHGGRSNFTYGKRNDAVDAPRSRSLDRTEKPGTVSRTDRKREESPVAKPRTDNRNFDRAEKPNTATRTDRKREESPVAKPRTDKRKQETAPSKPSRGNTTTTRPTTETRSRQTTATPKRETQPQTNSGNLNKQSRSTNSSSPMAAPTRTERKSAPAAAPKTNRTESMNSRPKSSTGSKAPVKSESRQSRGGRG